MLRDEIIAFLQRNNIKYTPWKRDTEARIMCPNPKHDDRNASCSVNLETGAFGCFGCKKGGNISDLIFMVTGERINLSDLIDESEVFGLATQRIYNKSADNILVNENHRDFELLLQFVVEQFHLAHEHPVSLEYLTKERKLTIETIQKFRLGYCTEGRFENRVIIPYCMNGHNIGFNSRLIGVDKKTGSGARYRYYADQYYLERFVYNLDNKLCADRKICILVEGPFDLMYLTQCGFKNVISPLTTHISSYQMASILEFEKIIFCFDNDDNKAGFNSMMKHAKTMLKHFPSKEIYYVKLPQNKDPNECTPEELRSTFKSLYKLKLQGDTYALNFNIENSKLSVPF